MIKIIIPIDADTLECTAALLKMSMKPGNRDAVNTAVTKIKQDGMVEVTPEILQECEDEEALAGIASLAIASSLKKNLNSYEQKRSILPEEMARSHTSDNTADKV